jgi:DDE superfamily endonuclease
MEEVLETYAKPYDPTCPVLCMDEQSVQLVKETRKPIEATAKHPRRVDYEYEQAGTASIFMFTEPLSGWRIATARPSKTKVDWALEMARLRDRRYQTCEKVILVGDNLNTHPRGAFYEAFKPAPARQDVRRMEFRHTPQHGRWLNVAENELSSMTRQSIGRRRIGTLNTLQEQIHAWSTDVNTTQRGVDWQMKIDDARGKLKSVYPQLKR